MPLPKRKAQQIDKTLARLKRQSSRIYRRMYDQLDMSPDVCSGAVRIAGTRLAADCLGGYFAGGDSIDDIAWNLVTTRRRVEQCVRLVTNARFARKSPEFVFAQWQRRIGAEVAR